MRTKTAAMRPAFMRRLVTTTLLLGLSTMPAAALVTFAPGTPAKASEVNANFTELADRLDEVEDWLTGDSVAVDCGTDPSTLATTVAAAGPGDTLTITGTCNGPITVTTPGLTLTAATPGTDGIRSAGDDTAVLMIQARHVSVAGLRIEATVPTDSHGILAIRNGSATINGVVVTGAENSVSAGRTASLKLQNTIDVDKVAAFDGGVVRLESFPSFDAGDDGFLLGASRNGAVDIRPGVSALFSGIRVADGGHVKGRSGANVTVRGRVGLYRSASAFFEGPVTIDYADDPENDDPGVSVIENATLRFTSPATIVNTSVEVAGSSTLRVDGADFNLSSNPASGGLIYVGLSSALVLEGSSVGGIEIDEKSSAYLNGVTVSGLDLWGDSFALEIDASYVGLEEGTVVSDKVFVEGNGVLEMEGSTINGDLLVRGNSTVSVEDGSAINATPASGNPLTCPTGWDEGIRISLGSSVALEDIASSISGFFSIDKWSAFSPGPVTSLPNLTFQRGSGPLDWFEIDYSTFDSNLSYCD